MTMSYWLLLLAVAYGAILFVVFAGLCVASSADQAADRALLAMLEQRRGIGKASLPVASRARAVPRRMLMAAHSFASSYR